MKTVKKPTIMEASQGLTPVTWTVQDEHNVSQSFDIDVYIWDPSKQAWVQNSIGILNLDTFSGQVNNSKNAIFNMAVDYHGVERSGSSHIKNQPGNLYFGFRDNANGNFGCIYFKPHLHHWHNVGTNQSKIDIDWRWNNGAPIIEIKDKK